MTFNNGLSMMKDAKKFALKNLICQIFGRCADLILSCMVLGLNFAIRGHISNPPQLVWPQRFEMQLLRRKGKDVITQYDSIHPSISIATFRNQWPDGMQNIKNTFLHFSESTTWMTRLNVFKCRKRAADNSECTRLNVFKKGGGQEEKQIQFWVHNTESTFLHF